MDRSIPKNPYLDEYKALHSDKMDLIESLLNQAPRHELVQKYSWAIPNKKALQVIKKVSPKGLIEIGAGKGYWANLLMQLGVDVFAYDVDPTESNPYLTMDTPAFTTILKGDSSVAKEFPERSLFLCWPSYNEPWAFEALKNHYDAGGSTLIYIGESNGGCCADEAFFEFAWTNYKCASCIQIPTWFGIHDKLYVFTRIEESL